MRRSIVSVAVLAAIAAAACTDTPPTGTQRPPNVGGALMTLSLEDYIQEQIDVLLPKGFEDAVDARWSTVRKKKAEGDLAGADQHLATLSTWIHKKTPEIMPPGGETKEHAATRLILNMARWLYEGATEPLTLGEDIAIANVPAGEQATVVPPSEHAGVFLPAGSTSEDRIIIVAEDESAYPAHCSGPLPTTRCQYPLFYRFQSIPNTKLNIPGQFAVCHVTTSDTRPLLEYPNDEGEHGAVHEHLRLARPKRADGTKTEGSIIEGDIEILPRSAVPRGFTNCPSPSGGPIGYALGPNTARRGWLGWTQRALVALTDFAGRLITPNNLYAYSSGPEHDGDFASPFNAVCYADHSNPDEDSKVCRPDISVASISAPAELLPGSVVQLSTVVENKSRRSGGEATAATQGTSATWYRSSDATLDEGDVSLGTVAIDPLAPDRNQPIAQTVTMPAASGTYYFFLSVDASPGFPEVALANNVATAAIVVRDNAVLIYGPALGPIDASHPQNEKTLAEAAGFTVTVADAATWSSYTASDFAKFRAIVFGDPNCVGSTGTLSTAEANKATWSSVINGPMVLVGTDHYFHQDDHPQGLTLASNGIKYAASVPGSTGAFVSLSCYYAGAAANTQVSFLSEIGDFRVTGQGGCPNQVTITPRTPVHPVMQNLTNGGLSNWGCSIHEFFSSMDSFPEGFEVLATGLRESSGQQLPYIIARSAGAP